MTIVPVVLGDGLPLFAGPVPPPMRLLDVTPYGNGMAELTYEVARDDGAIVRLDDLPALEQERWSAVAADPADDRADRRRAPTPTPARRPATR